MSTKTRADLHGRRPPRVKLLQIETVRYAAETIFRQSRLTILPSPGTEAPIPPEALIPLSRSPHSGFFYAKCRRPARGGFFCPVHGRRLERLISRASLRAASTAGRRPRSKSRAEPFPAAIRSVHRARERAQKKPGDCSPGLVFPSVVGRMITSCRPCRPCRPCPALPVRPLRPSAHRQPSLRSSATGRRRRLRSAARNA